jgi:branched-chain amino acid transport system ATP-binding protein
LSLGRGRLVELARALMCQPTLLFLDEPSSGLDHRETDEMCQVMTTVQADRGTAILLVEHDVPMVERLAQRTYVIDVGRMIADGPTKDVLALPAVRAAYLGQGV